MGSPIRLFPDLEPCLFPATLSENVAAIAHHGSCHWHARVPRKWRSRPDKSFFTTALDHTDRSRAWDDFTTDLLPSAVQPEQQFFDIVIGIPELFKQILIEVEAKTNSLRDE